MNNVLIIQTASIGDVILATSVVENIHLQYPNAKIDFLLKKGNESLFESHPFINQMLIWDKSKNKYRNLSNLISSVRKNKYNIVINLQRFLSSGLITTFSKADITIGFKKNPLSFLFTEAKEHIIQEGTHEIDRNLSLISKWVDLPKRYIKLYPTEHDINFVSEYIVGNYITISPASLWTTKQFPKEKWVEFLKYVPENISVYLLGSKKDSELCKEIIKLSGKQNSKNLAGKLSILQSAALMQSAQMNYANDSAPAHLSSATNAPITVIFCSTVPYFGFGPLSDISFIVENKEDKLDCRPCGIHGHRNCPKEHFKCGYGINIFSLVENLNYGK